MDVICHHCHDLPVASPGQGSVTCSPLQENDTLVIPTACRAQSKEWVTFHLPRAVQNETQEEKERQTHFRYRQPLKYKAPQSLIHLALGGTGQGEGTRPLVYAEDAEEEELGLIQGQGHRGRDQDPAFSSLTTSPPHSPSD